MERGEAAVRYQPSAKSNTQVNTLISYLRGSGAGPGGRISCSPVWTRLRVTNQTAAVHVGKRSAPGINLAAADGRNAQCQPRSRIITKATTRSRNESAGDKAPSAKSGKAAISRTSAAMATAQAMRCSGSFSDLK